MSVNQDDFDSMLPAGDICWHLDNVPYVPLDPLMMSADEMMDYVRGVQQDRRALADTLRVAATMLQRETALLQASRLQNRQHKKRIVALEQRIKELESR